MRRATASWGRRGLVVAGLVAVVGAVLATAAAAFITLTGQGTGSASVGQVSMGLSASPSSTTCTFGSLAPGDLTGANTCVLSVTYTGTIPAFLSLTVAVQSRAGAGGHLLFDGTNTAGLTLAISDGRRSFTVPTGAGTTGGSCPSGATCFTVPNELAAWYAGVNPVLAFTTGKSVTWTVTPRFPATVDNSYQGASATVTLTAQAVQAPANALPGTCTVATVGQSCPASGSFTWSQP